MKKNYFRLIAYISLFILFLGFQVYIAKAADNSKECIFMADDKEFYTKKELKSYLSSHRVKHIRLKQDITLDQAIDFQEKAKCSIELSGYQLDIQGGKQAFHVPKSSSLTIINKEISRGNGNYENTGASVFASGSFVTHFITGILVVMILVMIFAKGQRREKAGEEKDE